MFNLYKKVLPRCEGYINEGGQVNLQRLGLLLEELAKEEYRIFEHEAADEKWFRSKKQSMAQNAAAEKIKAKGKLTVTTSQKNIWKQQIRKFVQKPTTDALDLGSSLNAADRKFVQDLADSVNLSWITKEDEDGNRHLLLSSPKKPAAADDDDEDDEDEEAHLAVYRVLKKYDAARSSISPAADAQAAMEVLYQQKYQEWKDSYYADKFEWTAENKEDELRKLCENYVQGLQWVLYYYYRGIASWPWFYRYHYSPMTSDVMKGLNADLKFTLGQPFKPFEQLMGVLPDRSKKIVRWSTGSS